MSEENKTIEEQDIHRRVSRASKWSLVSIAGIISLAAIAIICLFVLFTPSHMIVAGWIVTALAVMGIAMAGAVIKA